MRQGAPRQRPPKPANSNLPSIEDLAETAAILDWVRPVFTTMKSIAIPDAVAQKTMTYLLKHLDKHLETRE